MKKIKLLLLMAVVYLLPKMGYAQVTNGDNSYGPGEYLGWDLSGSFGGNGVNPLPIKTNNQVRQKINGDILFNASYFQPGVFTWYNTNYLNYNIGTAPSTNNPQGYIMMGRDLTTNDVPRTRLHLQGSVNLYGPGTGWRPWMQTGVYMNEYSNQMYVGMYKSADSTPGDAVINWGDDITSSKKLRVNFTAAVGVFPASGTPLYDRDREVASFWPSRVVGSTTATSDNMGLGDFANFTSGPQSHFHMNNSFGNSDFIQVTTGGIGTNTTGFTLNDGLSMGIKGATSADVSSTALIYQQENRPLLLSTNASTSTSNLVTGATLEKMRITCVGTPTYLPTGGTGIYNPGALNVNNTRVSISLDPAKPVTRPLSLLHLGYNMSVSDVAGWRPWMEQGIFNTNESDHVYIGIKPEPAQRNDAVIGWGNTNPAAYDTTGPDNLRFIFSRKEATFPTPAGDGEDQLHGREVSRFTPGCIGCPLPRPSMGIGNFAPSGTQGPGTAAYVGATLDVDGDARIRVIPNDNTLTKVLVVDSMDRNRIHWRDVATLGAGSALGNNCGLLSNPLANDWEIPMNAKNFRFADPTGPLTDNQNFVGIGTTCIPAAKLEVIRKITTNSATDVIGTRVENKDVATFPYAAKATGIQAIVNGPNKENRGIMSEASAGATNFGVYGAATASYVSALSANATNTGIYGTAADALGNTGVSGFALANSGAATTANYGGSFIATNNSTGAGGLSPLFNFGSNNLAVNTGNIKDNIGVYGVAENNGNADHNVGVAGIARGANPANFDIGVYGEGAIAAYFTGPITYSGSLGLSDSKIKTNVSAIENGLELLKKMKPVTYDFKTAEYPELHLSGKKQYGFIAQELEQAIPALVGKADKPEFKDKDGKVISKGIALKGINYDGIIPVLAQAIKEQQDIIEKEIAANKALRDRLELLEACVQRLNLCSNNAPAGNPRDDSAKTTQVTLHNAPAIVLDQNVPNPFAEQTVITYTLNKNVQKAQMMFYNAEGKLINSVELTERGKGSMHVFGHDLSSGIYTYTLVVDGQIFETKKMIKQ